MKLTFRMNLRFRINSHPPAVGAELAQQREGVGAHELPDQAERQRLVARQDVVALDADEHEVELLAQLDGVVAVGQDLHVALRPDLAVRSLAGRRRRIQQII